MAMTSDLSKNDSYATCRINTTNSEILPCSTPKTYAASYYAAINILAWDWSASLLAFFTIAKRRSQCQKWRYERQFEYKDTKCCRSYHNNELNCRADGLLQ
jgi:hypothetical protein